MLQDVAIQCPSFKFGKEALSTALKEIADFKSPGVYELTDFVKKRELITLQQELGKAGDIAGEQSTSAVAVPSMFVECHSRPCSSLVIGGILGLL